jgi:hypothetical protein
MILRLNAEMMRIRCFTNFEGFSFPTGLGIKGGKSSERKGLDSQFFSPLLTNRVYVRSEGWEKEPEIEHKQYYETPLG